jgi:hypothetical protein
MSPYGYPNKSSIEKENRVQSMVPKPGYYDPDREESTSTDAAKKIPKPGYYDPTESPQ